MFFFYLEGDESFFFLSAVLFVFFFKQVMSSHINAIHAFRHQTDTTDLFH